MRSLIKDPRESRTLPQIPFLVVLFFSVAQPGGIEILSQLHYTGTNGVKAVCFPVAFKINGELLGLLSHRWFIYQRAGSDCKQ